MAHVRQMRVCEWQVAEKGKHVSISCRCERRVGLGFDRAPRGSHAHGSAQSSTERALAPPQPSQRFATRPGLAKDVLEKFQNQRRVIVATGMFQPVAHSQRLCLFLLRVRWQHFQNGPGASDPFLDRFESTFRGRCSWGRGGEGRGQGEEVSSGALACTQSYHPCVHLRRGTVRLSACSLSSTYSTASKSHIESALAGASRGGKGGFRRGGGEVR